MEDRISYGYSSANQLTLSAKPLTLRNERNTIALLMHRQIAAVTENDSIGIFTVSIVTDGAFTVLFFAS
jgi:hypothetical protein